MATHPRLDSGPWLTLPPPLTQAFAQKGAYVPANIVETWDSEYLRCG